MFSGLIVGQSTSAQTSDAPSGNVRPSSAASLVEVEGVVIDSIAIYNRNVYDTDKPEYDNFLFKTANRLHVVTREAVIRRELLFEVGDRFSAELADETARNLRARFELYDAWIETDLLPNGHLLVRVVTVDTWSLYVRFNILRDGNRTDLKFGLEERNLLGYNKFISSDFVVQEDDDDFLTAQFRDDRAFGKAVRLKLDYSSNPVGWTRFVSLNRPYYSLSQRLAFGFGYANQGGRTDVYRDNARIASSESEGDWVSLSSGYRLGGYRQKIDLSLFYDYVSETTTDKRIFHPADSGLVSFPEDSTYHQILGRLGLYNMDFVKLTHINGFDYTEDFTLGQSFSVAGGRAFLPGFDDHLYDRLEFSLSNVIYHRSNLLSVSYVRTQWFRDAEIFRRLSHLLLRYYNNHLSFVTLAMRLQYLSDWRSDGIDPLLLGGISGLRGYDKYYRTGDRRALLNVEGRFFSGLEILTVKFGGTVFFDAGQIWKNGEPLKLDSFDHSIGVGLRISFEKSTKGEVVRVDLATGQDNSWQLSASAGQYF